MYSTKLDSHGRVLRQGAQKNRQLPNVKRELEFSERSVDSVDTAGKEKDTAPGC